METVNAGYTMSFAALQRQDPYINKLLDVTSQVALYNFNSKVNEWEKTEIEGTLFVYARSTSPHHGFTIMNRLNKEDLVEPINKDLEFQLQDPFLLYRNGNLGIYSIWFFDKRDCQRIAQLMVKIVKQEADCARRESPEGVNGAAEPRSTDILELLSKAKEEYQRAQGGKRDTSAELNVTAASSTAEHVHCSSQQEKSSPSKVKQITVEELFDSSLPKDATSVIFPVQHTTTACSGLSISYHQNQSCSAPAHLNQLPPSNLPSPDSRSNQQSQAPILPQAPYVLHPSPIFKSMVPKSEHQPLCSVFPLMMPPAGSEPHAAPPGCAASPCTTYMRKEVLSTLKPAVSSVHMNIHKPVLAPNFLPSALLPPHSFQEPTVIPPPQHMNEVDSLSQPSNLIKPLSTVAMRLGLAGPAAEISVLLSPSAFQQSMNKTPAAMSGFPPAPSELSSSDVGVVDPPEAPCRKAQLQETLIYLIKNDAAFFRAIHEHLQTVTNDFSNMKV